MAQTHAIAATATTLLRMLARDCPRDGFRTPPTFALRPLGQAGEAAHAEGVSVWVWRIQPTSTATRSTPLRTADGATRPPDLVVDLSVLVRVQAAEPEEELRLTGWVMRWLADHAVLTSADLGGSSGASSGGNRAPAFGATESLTLLIDSLSPEDRLQLSTVDGGRWMGAVPCAVRGLRLESAPPKAA